MRPTKDTAKVRGPSALIPKLQVVPFERANVNHQPAYINGHSFIQLGQPIKALICVQLCLS